MNVIKKTVSMPEDIYEEIKKLENSKNFSQIVKKALREYIEKRKKERIMSFAGVLKDWKIEDGKEFLNEIRKEDIKSQEEREKFWDI